MLTFTFVGPSTTRPEQNKRNRLIKSVAVNRGSLAFFSLKTFFVINSLSLSFNSTGIVQFAVWPDRR